MRFKILVYAVCIFIIILLQSTILDFIEVFNVKPNLIIIFVVSVALLRGNVEGAVIGFLTGFMNDIVSGKLLGFYALLGLYLGLIIGSVNKKLYRENFLVILFFAFASTVAYEGTVFVLSSFSSIIDGHANVIYALKDVILPESIYNCVVSLFVYIFVIKLNDRFEEIDKASRKY